MPKVSLYSAHVERWGGCVSCDSHLRRTNVVLYRGQIPCDVLFVGEAPGESEDVLGKPFVGPAGKLLDDAIRIATVGHKLRVGMTNVVACIPRDESGRKVEEPPDESVKACSGRLIEIVTLARPKLIVCVGKMAEDWLRPNYKHSIKIPPTKLVRIIHPAAILRAGWDQREYLQRQSIATIRGAVEDLTTELPLSAQNRVVLESSEEDPTEGYF